MYAASHLEYNEAGDVYGNIGNGGAIYNTGALNVTNSFLTNNIAYGGSGGAIYSARTLNVTGSTLSSNSAAYGGAIYNGYRLTATITCTFIDNSAAYGGAIWNNGAITISGSASGGYTDIHYNNATMAGGGIYNAKSGKLTITLSRVYANSAPPAFGADLENVGWA